MATYNRKDHYYKKAKEEGYRSRASYKLLELDKKYKLFEKGFSVLDLGSFPGGWLQVAAEKVSSTGKVVGVDLAKIDPFLTREFHTKDFSFPIVFCGDMTDKVVQEKLLAESEAGYHVILSDLSPKLSGVRLRDTARGLELVRAAFDLAPVVLKKGGTLVAKIFPSEEAVEIFNEQKKRFKTIKRENVSSSRSTSNEFYLVAKGFL